MNEMGRRPLQELLAEAEALRARRQRAADEEGAALVREFAEGALKQNRNPATDGKRLLLWEEQARLCALCGEAIEEADLFQAEIDHRFPHVLGGGNEPGNLQLAHKACNRRKSAKYDLDDAVAYIERTLD